MTDDVVRLGRPRSVYVDELAVVARYAAGESSKKISEDLGIANSLVLSILRSHKVDIRRSGPSAVVSSDVRKSIRERYLAGESASAIARNVGVCHQLVERWLHADGIQFRRTKAGLRGIKEDIFDAIDTSEKAYWLGFLGADGWITKQNVVGLSLKSGDLEHVKKFARFVGCAESQIVHRSDDRRDEVQLIFKSVRVANSLRLHGFSEKKSRDFTPIVPAGFEKDFWRGMVDGDGSLPDVVRDGKVRDVLQLTGTQEVCQKFRAWCECVVGVACGCISDRRSYADFSVEGVLAKKLILHLYSGAGDGVRLERKYAQAMSHG
jgi:transposase